MNIKISKNAILHHDKHPFTVHKLVHPDKLDKAQIKYLDGEKIRQDTN